MKKLLLIVCFSILLTQAHAQKESHEKEVSIDSMLVNIDKSTFTSGILYDRVAGLSQAFQFNKNPKNTATVNYFEQVLNDLYKASNEKKLVNYKEYRKKYANKKVSNVVDIGVINASFHQLNYNENSDEKSGLSFNGKQFT